MGFEQIDEACIAGQRAENSDFATPAGTAGINPLKIAKRNTYVPFHFPGHGIVTSGSVVFATPGCFPAVTLQSGGSGYIYVQASCPRGEISPGEKGTLQILWYSAATTGNARIVADLVPAINGVTSLASVLQRAAIQSPNTVASSFQIMKMEFPPAMFNANQIWALKLARDPANTLDTMADDFNICAIWMEILGRC